MKILLTFFQTHKIVVISMEMTFHFEESGYSDRELSSSKKENEST